MKPILSTKSRSIATCIRCVEPSIQHRQKNDAWEKVLKEGACNTNKKLIECCLCGKMNDKKHRIDWETHDGNDGQGVNIGGSACGECYKEILRRMP